MSKTIDGGLVIAFDGPDGIGKSTQAALYKEYLTQQGYIAHLTAMSGGTPIGEALRQAMLSDNPRPAETDVYISLAMGVALAEDLGLHRARGEICLIDRSPLAVIAYNTYGSQLANKEWGMNAAELLFKRLAVDALVMFTANPATINERRNIRTDKPLDFYENKGDAYHQRVNEGYDFGKQFAAKQLGIHVLDIEAEGPKQQVHRSVVQTLQPYLPS
ncbi:MAG: dTMP kinase [Candidatus Saccharibacteria bacterium]|nr:dTMP kinase [Candidatus Saccharibacteria bacterium]